MRSTIAHRTFATSTFVSLLALAACVDAPEDEREESVDPNEATEQARGEIEVCAEGDLVPGIDVSYWQGDIDWDAVAGTDVKFVITRISDGDFLDTVFDTNWPAIKERGLIRGAYQFFRPMEDIQLQADIVIDAVGMLGAGDLPVTIDVEAPNPGVSKATYVDRISEWMELVEAGTGKKPIIYTGRYYWQDWVGSDDFKEHPLWHAQYPNACLPPNDPPPACGSCPNIADQFDTWAFWQYTSSGRVAGIDGNVDRNVFNGTYQQLQQLAGAGYAAEVVSVDVAASVAKGTTAAVKVRLRNTGSLPWDESTSIGTTEPRDRDSALADASWPSPNRAATVSGTVDPGAETTLTFNVKAPATVGPVEEHFGLLQESVTWFADAGGPADDAIVVAFQVTDAPPASNTSAATGAATSGGNDNLGGSGGGAAIEDGDDEGCDCTVGAHPKNQSSAALAALALGAMLLIRRRRS